MTPPVYSLLAADSGVIALTSTRIFQSRRPPVADVQGDLPCITFRLITGFPLISMDSDIGLDYLRTQIDCWAADPGVADQIAEAAVDVLRLTGHINYLGDDYDEDTRIHRASFDWLCWQPPS